MNASAFRISTELGEVHVLRRGKGPPVLLLHGIASGHAAFDAQLSALDGEFTLLAWDAPGYGLSDDVTGPCDLDHYASAAVRILQESNAVPAHLVGVSWGGVLATRLALDYPDVVTTLALVSSTVGRAGNAVAQHDLRARIAALERDGIEAWARARVDRVLGTSASPKLRAKVCDTMVGSVRLRGFTHAAATLAATDHRQRLPEINVPTLVLVGDRDRVTGISEARLLSCGISGARLEIIADAGHLINQEQPAAVNPVLRNLWSSYEEGTQ